MSDGHDSRTAAQQPLRILCQHDHGSCAACCGVHNFRDRTATAEEARLARRTAHVQAAWPDVDALRAARDTLLALEAPDVLFAAVKVCPFAGYVEPGRVGCLLHPSRHPTGDDLRDLAVYPRAVCEGHFCAPHDWLRPHEVDLAQTVRGTFYGVVVTDAGLVKGLAALLEERLGRRYTRADLARADAPLTTLWALLRAWPWRDRDPRRFGTFAFAGDDAQEQTLPSSLAGRAVACPRAMARVLDGLGSRLDDDDAARAAVALLGQRLDDVVTAMSADLSPAGAAEAHRA